MSEKKINPYAGKKTYGFLDEEVFEEFEDEEDFFGE